MTRFDPPAEDRPHAHPLHLRRPSRPPPARMFCPAKHLSAGMKLERLLFKVLCPNTMSPLLSAASSRPPPTPPKLISPSLPTAPATSVSIRNSRRIAALEWHKMEALMNTIGTGDLPFRGAKKHNTSPAFQGHLAGTLNILVPAGSPVESEDSGSKVVWLTRPVIAPWSRKHRRELQGERQQRQWNSDRRPLSKDCQR